MKKINKKGYVYVLLMLIMITLALFMMLIGFQHKYSDLEIDGIEVRIGMYSSAIIKAYQEQEGAMIYLDNAAKVSLMEAIRETGGKGALPIPECGNSGYNLWNTKTENCIPDYKENFKTIFIENLADELMGFYQFSLSSEHTLTLKQDKNNLKLVGITPEKVKIAITISGDVVKRQTEVISAEIPAETTDRINQYDALIETTAQKYDLEVAFMKAIITQESQGKPLAMSGAGALGLFQFTYPTATEYFPKKDLTDFKTCARNKPCPPNEVAQDPRTKPELAIPAGGKYLKHISNMDSIKDTSDLKPHVAAAYNGGPALIIRAIKNTGKSDPSWEETSAQITPALLRTFSDYRGLSDETLKGKVKQINDYVNFVSAYYEGWGGMDLFSPSIIGYFEFGQNFRTQTDYNLTFYEEVIKFAEEAIADCKDDVSNCLETKRIAFNDNHKEEMLYLTDCEEETEKVFYDFIENLNDCANAWGDECKCPITESYNAKEIESFEGTYELKFGEKQEVKPITNFPEITFTINLTKPKVLSADFTIKDNTFWEPISYEFKYKDELKNEEITFHDSLQSKNFKRGDFDKLFMVIKDDKYSLQMEYNNKLYDATKQESEIETICPVAKQIFRLCAKTKTRIPIVKDDSPQDKLVFEESKIKFAITLIDEVTPPEINNLNMNWKLDGTVKLSWQHKTIQDMAAYEVKLEKPDGTMVLVGEFYTTEEQEGSINIHNKLFYEDNGGEKNYGLLINPSEHGILANEKYTFHVTPLDNFQNKGKTISAILLPK